MNSHHDYRQPMAINFDTTGLQPDPSKGPDSWIDPATGDGIALQYCEGDPFEAAWMHDMAALRRGFAHMYAKMGCLIEVELVPLGNARAVHQLVKVPLPNAPAGQLFLSTFTLTKAGRYAQLMRFMPETGITGTREVMISQRLGMPQDWVLPHPFDPGLESALPFHRGDDPAWDPQFPDHPLSRARRWAAHVRRTAQVDPRWAALPELG